MASRIDYKYCIRKCHELIQEKGTIRNGEPVLHREELINHLSTSTGVAGGRTRVIVDLLEATKVILKKSGNKYAIGALPEGKAPEPKIVEIEKEVEKIVEVEKEVVKEVVKEIVINNKALKGPKAKKKIKDHVHMKYEQVLKLADQGKNIMMTGPTGSGKTRLGSDIAKGLSRRFGFISCSMGMSEGQITGRLLPTGTGGKFQYSPSEFVTCYEKGGVFLLDEMDAADANVLLTINSALANGYLSIPNRVSKPVAERHEDFVMIAACNTLGSGASRQYSGRNQLDASTLDRFLVGKVFVDYDRDLEDKLCENKELLSKCWIIRERIDNARLERAMSTRFILDAQDMINAGVSIKGVFESYYLGWRQDEIDKVESSI